LAEYFKVAKMDGKGDQDAPQASVPKDLSRNPNQVISSVLGEGSQGGGGPSPVPVLVELLRHVAPLSSEEPQEILRLFVRLGEINDLELVDDKQFITRILPLVSGSVLKFLGECLHEGCDWASCKTRLLDEYFPYFVRERLIRDLVVCNFHAARQPMRTYIEQGFQAAEFLQYGATEQQLVDRVLMNFHPEILAKAAFLDRPRSRKDLFRIVGLLEEKISAAKERPQVERTPKGACNST